MSVILKKKIICKLYESDKSLIYRAFDNINKQHVVLKILKAGCLDPYETARYKNEYEIIRSFDLESPAKTHSFEKYNGSYVLILEDIQGVSLNKFCENRVLDLEEYLEIAINIVTSLGIIHEKNIIHKNLNPSNIIYNPQTRQIKIIDFGISSVFLKGIGNVKKTEDIESDVAYISPEQTGKMDCLITFRSDFYSLGIMFYELFGGTLPFTDLDPMGMVHAHFAKQPLELYRLNSKIPKPLSDIVMKLMEKNPDNRYQNTLSIINALTQCRHLVKNKSQNFSSAVHTPNLSDELKICDQIFGREKELDKLSSLFKEVCMGRKKYASVSGNAGVGKTALVMEFCKKNVLNKGYFISGKFDQVHQDNPLGAIVDAFSQLIRQILMEKESIFKQYRNNLQTSLGNNGQLMIDLFPELEYIIGPQNPVAELPIVEAQNRFTYVFQNFIRGFMHLGHPIVFFLDDLQWADASSLNFLQRILFSEGIEFGFFIGAFRDNEVDHSHPWHTALNDFKKNGLETSNIHLDPLNLTCVNQFVSSSLHCSSEKCFDLSELVGKKTTGNPFFIKEFLKSVYEKKMLEFDMLTNTWKWKLAQIEEMSVTGTVTTLVMDKLHSVNLDTMNLLKNAACMGNRFHVDTLSLICDMSLSQVIPLLNEAVKQGILIRISDACKFINGDNHSTALKEPKEYKFSHDRFQNVAYSLIKQKDKANLHWKIGNLLLEARPDRENREDILGIANHLNLGKPFITKESQKHKLAKINLLAAKKAKRASAYQAAFSYLEAGVSIFCPDIQTETGIISPWDKDYDLCLSLHETAAETAFLVSSYDRMEVLSGIINKKAKKLTDLLKINQVRIRALFAQNRLLEAIDLALSFAGKLGVKLPKRPTMAHVSYELFKMKFFLKGKDIEKFADLPAMTNLEKIAAINILSSMTMPAVYALPNLVPLIIFKAVQLSVTSGNTETSLFAYAGYGLIMCGITGDISIGYQFGELARKLLSRLNAGRMRARTLLVVHGFIRHWKVHIREILPPLLEAIQSGLEFGDHQYTASCVQVYCSGLLYTGIDLEKVDQDTKSYSELVKKLNQSVALKSILIVRQTVDNLKGKSENPWQLKESIFNYEKMYPLLETSNDQWSLFTANLMSLILCFLFEKYDMAVEFIPRIRQHLNVAKGSPDTAVFNFFESLSILAFLQKHDRKNQKKYLSRVRKNQEQMKKWSQFAPMNFEHLFCLVEAERFNLEQNSKNAKTFYDLAIQYSNKNGYINYEAIANELTGKFYLKHQDLNRAKDYILLAHHSYMRWGALRKAIDMEKKYGLFFQKYALPNVGTGFKNIDIYAVLKASQAISKTMEFDRLMTELVRVVIEYSGAQKACIFLYSDKVLKIEAIAKTDPDKIKFFNSMVVDEKNTEFPLSILYYSIRSRQSVILKDASKKNKFTSDPYFMESKPFSILCKPLIKKNTVIGILYLENNLLNGAFSEGNLNILDFFTSQILVSIENSQLYEALVREIENKDKAVIEIKAKQELLQNVSAELVSAEERERKTIAEDLHDSVSQSLAFSISRLKSLDLSDLYSTTDQLLEVLTFLTQAANNIRSLTFQLSPPLLRDLGFEDSLEWLCEDFFTRYDLKILFKNGLQESVCLDETVKLILYRAVRELAMNIVKHARVKSAELNLFLENNYFVVVLEDKGAGFDVQSSLEKSQRFGLFSIYKRMEAINGSIEIFSEKTKGTKVIIKIAAFS
jgi:predicted ATPase/signal transduction histidine kinase